MWLAFYDLGKDIETIEALLYELAALNNELRYLGLKSTLHKLNFIQSKPAFEEFSEKLAVCARIAPLISKDLSTQLTALLAETKIENSITQFAVRIRLSEIEKPLSQNLFTFFSILSKALFKAEPKQLFSDDTIPLENVLASLSRLKTIVKLLSEEYRRKKSNDDEIFKPSNVDINIVITQINLAIENLETVTILTKPEKERLVIYLKEAMAELASDTPAWKKVIGALIVCATLLSGLADAPQAIQNLNTAIKHILGSSVEKALPNLLPVRPLENDQCEVSVGEIGKRET